MRHLFLSTPGKTTSSKILPVNVNIFNIKKKQRIQGDKRIVTIRSSNLSIIFNVFRIVKRYSFFYLKANCCVIEDYKLSRRRCVSPSCVQPSLFIFVMVYNHYRFRPAVFISAWDLIVSHQIDLTPSVSCRICGFYSKI